jgi:hypothetical protein
VFRRSTVDRVARMLRERKIAFCQWQIVAPAAPAL